MVRMNKASIIRRSIYCVIFLVSFYVILIFPSLPHDLVHGSGSWVSFKIVGKSLKNENYEVIHLVQGQESYSNEMKNTDSHEGLITKDILKEYSFSVSSNNVGKITDDINAKENTYTLKIDNTGNITHVILRESQNTTYWYYYDIENGIPGNFRLGSIGLAWPAISLVLSFCWIMILFLSIQIMRTIYRRLSSLREKIT